MKTPDWILKGEKKPATKKKEKTFRVKKCPECGSTEIEVVLGGGEGKASKGWECKACKWKGKSPDKKELSEKEFMENLDKMEGK